MSTMNAGTLPHDAAVERPPKRIAFAASATTGVFAAMMALSGTAYVLVLPFVGEAFHQLGYPRYFARMLGVAKLLGVVGLLVPGTPRIRQWAYAGFAFNLVAAVASHVIVGPASQAGPALVALALMCASFVLRDRADAATIAADVGRPTWLSPGLFPFESRFVTCGGARFHYVDEGHGPTLLFIHGGPMSSFMWRHSIAVLRRRYRCVAVDLPGLGASKAPLARGEGFARMADALQAFVQQMGLESFTLIVHATGGPAALEMAIRERARLRGMVISNTFAWPLAYDRDATIRRMVGLVSSSVFGFLVVALNLLPRITAHVGRRHGKMTRDEQAAVLGPYGDVRARAHLANLLHGLRVETPFFTRLSSRLSALAHLPVLLAFGEQDNGYKAGFLDRFGRVFPTAATVVLPRAAHFLTEDAPEAYTAALEDWLDLNALRPGA